MNEDTKTPAEQIAALKQLTAERCAAEIRQVCEKYGCDLVPEPFIDDEGRVRARVRMSVK